MLGLKLNHVSKRGYRTHRGGHTTVDSYINTYLLKIRYIPDAGFIALSSTMKCSIVGIPAGLDLNFRKNHLFVNLVIISKKTHLRIHSKSYAYYSHFVVSRRGLIITNFIHIPQDNVMALNGRQQHNYALSVIQTIRILVNKPIDSTNNWLERFNTTSMKNVSWKQIHPNVLG